MKTMNYCSKRRFVPSGALTGITKSCIHALSDNLWLCWKACQRQRKGRSCDNFQCFQESEGIIK